MVNPDRSDAAGRGLTPSSRLEGVLRPPGSKSEAQRALVAAALCDGVNVITGLPDGEDVAAGVELVAACGASVHRTTPERVLVEGIAPTAERGLSPRGVVQVGESGTLARFATAALALGGEVGRAVTIAARGTLLLRQSPSLFRALVGCGVEITRQNLEGSWPVQLRPARPPAVIDLVDPASSQEVSALLIAAAAVPTRVEVRVEGTIPSRPYVELTRHVLARFGVEVLEEQEGRFVVEERLCAVRDPIVVEPDASGAAVALVGACLSGGEITIPDLGLASPQGDVRVVEHLRAFGCTVEATADRLRASAFPTRGAEVDLSGEPDLAPPLAALAAGVARRHGGTSVLTGLGTLPGKESDRLSVLAHGLSRVGFAAETGPDFLRIGPGAPVDDDATVTLDPHGDHRMAFAFALLGLLRPGIFVSNPTCVAKSWTRFWEDLEDAGAAVRNPAVRNQVYRRRP